MLDEEETHAAEGVAKPLEDLQNGTGLDNDAYTPVNENYEQDYVEAAFGSPNRPASGVTSGSRFVPYLLPIEQAFFTAGFCLMFLTVKWAAELHCIQLHLVEPCMSGMQ